VLLTRVVKPLRLGWCSPGPITSRSVLLVHRGNRSGSSLAKTLYIPGENVPSEANLGNLSSDEPSESFR
jgi:hypothetical protein